MTRYVHVCVDPLRVFCDAAYDPPPDQKPRSGPGKGNDATEAAVTQIIELTRDCEAKGIPTFWSFMERDSFAGEPLGVEKSGGGLHPRLIEAFPRHKSTAIPKYGQSAFTNYQLTKLIEEIDADAAIFTGFLASECVKDSAADMDLFYPKRQFAHFTRYVATDAIADNTDDAVNTPKGIKSMVANGVTANTISEIMALTQRQP